MIQNFSKFDFFNSVLLIFGEPKKLVSRFSQKPIDQFLTIFLIHAQDRQIEKDWGRHQHGLREVKDHMNGDDWIGGRLERKGKTILFVGSMVI
jgi:hypothetical protein